MCFTATDWQRMQHLAMARGLAGVCLGLIEAAQATFGANFWPCRSIVTAALREAARTRIARRHPPARLALHAAQAFLAQPTLRLRLR